MTKKVQYCACKINLAGQNCHTVIYNEHNPVTWPEMQVLMMLHGEENVMDIMPVGIGEVWPTEEKNRLAATYGRKVVEACFPGRAFRMDYMMTAEENLPRYVDGELVAAGAEPKPGDPKPQPAPPPPPPKKDDDNNGDMDDGEDEDEPSAAAAGLPALEPIFKPGRNRRPEVNKGA